MKTINLCILLMILMSTCSEHDRTTVILTGLQNQKEVVYQTSRVDFYLGYDDLIEYCKKKDNGEPNDFVFAQILDYIQSFTEDSILIPDTLGTKMAIESEVMFNHSDSLIRVRDQNHPYAYITEELEGMIFEFAKKGRLEIFIKESGYFVDTIVFNKINTEYYGGEQIDLTNGFMVLSRDIWIR